jgi:hypothetical protein
MFQVNGVYTKFNFLSENLQAKIVGSRIARHYNNFSENQRIVLEKKASGMTTMITAIVGGDENRVRNFNIKKIPVTSALKNTTYPDEMAEALIIHDGEKTYTVIVCHQEVNSRTDMVKALECLGFGNVIVFDHNEETIGGKVLNW